MNKLSKIFLGIIIILLIVIAIITCFYFDLRKKAYVLRDAYVDIATDLVNMSKDNQRNDID